MTTLDTFWKKSKEQRYQLRRAEVKPQYLIANQEMEIENGKVYHIPVERHKIMANHIIHLSPYSMKCGSVVGVCEKMPKPIDMDRNIEHVVYISIEKRKIKKGEVLGHFLVVPLQSGNNEQSN